MPAPTDFENHGAGLSAAAVARAEAALKGLAAEYERRAAQDVARLKAVLAELKAGAAAQSAWESLHRVSQT